MVADVRGRTCRAFTLIELLVVVAIIALLISILLPSLSKARDQAKQVVCSARLEQLGRAGATYQAENRDFFAGSPLTTGYHLAHRQPQLGLNSGLWQPGMPVNIYDYSIPLLRYMNVLLPKANDRRLYFPLTTSGAFECPSNQQVATPYSSVSGGAIAGAAIRATSYLTMNTLVRAGPAMYEYYNQNRSQLLSGIAPHYVAFSPNWWIVSPRGYVPRLDRLGRASLKVFLADGVRFFDGSSKQITYNVDTTTLYGFQSGQPPCDAINDDGSVPREYNQARQYSYRHGGGKVINAVMFDGHVESLRANFRSNTEGDGPALHPRNYFPSRTVVGTNSGLFMRSQIPNGTVLP